MVSNDFESVSIFCTNELYQDMFCIQNWAFSSIFGSERIWKTQTNIHLPACETLKQYTFIFFPNGLSMLIKQMAIQFISQPDVYNQRRNCKYTTRKFQNFNFLGHSSGQSFCRYWCLFLFIQVTSMLFSNSFDGADKTTIRIPLYGSARCWRVR